jgi:hypothetical protein
MPIPNIVYFDLETKKISSDFPKDANEGWGEAITHWFPEEGELTKRNVFEFGFGLAATNDNQATKLWCDPYDLVSYLISPQVDQIVTFNGNHFDYMVLLGELDPPDFSQPDPFSDTFKMIYDKLVGKSCDLLLEVTKVLGHRVGLDNLNRAMLNVQKEISGADFWKMYNSGDPVQHITSINYLISDVVNLYQIHQCAVALKQMCYFDAAGTMKKFDIELPEPADNIPF